MRRDLREFDLLSSWLAKDVRRMAQSAFGNYCLQPFDDRKPLPEPEQVAKARLQHKIMLL